MTDETVIIRRAPPSFAYLFWLQGPRRGDHAALDVRGTTVGRGREANIVLDDETVSAEQARLRFEEGDWYIYDLAAANRTSVAGETVARRRLADHDRLTFGMTEMLFRVIK